MEMKSAGVMLYCTPTTHAVVYGALSLPGVVVATASRLLPDRSLMYRDIPCPPVA